MAARALRTLWRPSHRHRRACPSTSAARVTVNGVPSGPAHEIARLPVRAVGQAECLDDAEGGAGERSRTCVVGADEHAAGRGTSLRRRVNAVRSAATSG